MIFWKKRIFTVAKKSVEIIVAELLAPYIREESNKEDNIWVGDRSITIFEPQYHVAEDGSKVMSCYNVTITNSPQFD